MEHSYSKDMHPKDNVEVMATRTILIPRPPQCPSCHHHTSPDDVLAKLDSQQTDPHFDQLPPTINDNIAKMAMDETDRLTKNVKNINADDEDWDLKINKYDWTKQQSNLYRQVSNILDYDQLARLAVNGRSNEGIIRRCSIDKSVSRMRLALATIHWDPRLTQWLHALLSDHLPPSYMATYLDILQTLRTKVPTLVDKMLSSRSLNFNQDYFQAVLKRPWGANVPTKQRKLPGQSPIIIVIPSSLQSSNQQSSSRMKRWFSLLGTMASIAPIQNTIRQSQTLEQITEQLVAVTRTKIQELRSEMPNRNIVLIGINTGASIALQVALAEAVSSIVCMGFAYNTVKGVRGAPDDRILDITIPILFVLGENSARASQEEIESLREKMLAQTSLVVVGSADDALRINKFNRHLEGVTQSMVDNMIADEIQDFVSTCIVNPPGPREVSNHKRAIGVSSASRSISSKKRKHNDSVSSVDKATPRKVGRPRLNKQNEMPSGKFKPERPKPTSALLKQSNEALKMAIQSILPSNETATLDATTDDLTVAISSEPTIINRSDLDGGEIISTFEVVTTNPNDISLQSIKTTISDTSTTNIDNSTVKLIPSTSPFVQLKPPTTSGRIQSPSVKNFFIRKGVEKKVPTQSFFTLHTQPILSDATPANTTYLSPNKKIIIKSQQIIKPAKQSTISGQTITTIPGTVLSASTIDSMTATTSSELRDILDLPILFADNDGNINDHTSEIASSQLATTDMPGTNTNILITSPEGKLPNRPVVISAANVAKITKHSPQTATNNKVIFINRNQLKTSPVTQPSATIVKTMPPLKLVSSTAITTGTNTFTKLAPGTKIDLSTLKILKSGKTSAASGLVTAKPIVFNKGGVTTIGSQPGRNTFLIKSTGGTSMQNHPAIKTGILNRNITVRKVVNLVQSSNQLAGQQQIILTSQGQSNFAKTSATSIISTTAQSNTSITDAEHST